MLQTLRGVLTIAALVPLGAFANAGGVRGRDWVAVRHGARLALFALECSLLAAWIACRWLLRLDRPFVPAGAPEIAVALAGGALAIGSALFAAAARRRLGRLFTPTFGVMRDHALVTDGPYAVTRHPVYTGLLGFFAGLGLLWNSPVTLAFALSLVVPLAWHTAIEEPLFVAAFGDAYRDYQRRTPRLVPFLRGPGGR